MNEDDRTRLGGGPGGSSGGYPPSGGQGGYGAPPPQQGGGYGPPPQPGGGYGAPPPGPPQGGYGGPPPPAGGYGAPPPGPPQHGGYGAPPPPPQQGGYGAPPPPAGGYGAPPPQGGYGAPPPQGYNQPPQYGAPPPTYPGGGGRQATSLDVNGLLGSIRLGDILAVGGALLFLISKFFPNAKFSASSSVTTPGIPRSLFSVTGNGWEATRNIWDFLQWICILAVIAAAVLIGLNLLPQFKAFKGWIYTIAGAALVLLTLIAYFDAKNAVGGGALSGLKVSPQFGFFALILFGLAVAAGGLMKQGIIPGDDAVSLGGGGAALGNRGPQPFSSNYYSGQQPPQPPQGGYGAPPPPAPPGGYGAPPPPPGPQGYGQPPGGGYGQPPPPQGYGQPPGGGYGNPPPPPR